MTKQVEVLVAFTNPAYWQLALKGNVAVQKETAPDAQYIAFLRIGLNQKIKSALTHIAKVDHVRTESPLKSLCQQYNMQIGQFPEPHADCDNPLKCYYLNNKLGIVKLARPIPKLPGENKGIVYFLTIYSELLRAKSVGEIRTLHELGLD